MSKAYLPDRGHLIWIEFSPQAGHEQAGRRPALVLSPASYNRKTGLCLICPVTNKAKGYPFEVVLPASPRVTGVVLADHVKNLDWSARRAVFIATAPAEVVAEVAAKIQALLI